MSRKDITYVVDDNIDTLDIDTTTENVGSDENTLLERLELRESVNTAGQYKHSLISTKTCRSGWGRPEWMQIDGKLHSCSRLSSWVARATDLTKIQTFELAVILRELD